MTDHELAAPVGPTGRDCGLKTRPLCVPPECELLARPAELLTRVDNPSRLDISSLVSPGGAR
jgi:hypothetical protein